MSKLLPLMASMLLAGCAVGPTYQAPQPIQLDAYASATSRNANAATERAFWSGFDDPVLERLIGQTLASNHNLQAMLARLEGADALLRGARRDQLPSITAGAGMSEQHLAEVERASPGDDRLEIYQAGIALSWEIDLFGRLASATRSRQAQFEASAADLAALQVALTGQSAASYFEMRGLQQQLRIAQQNVALQESSLAIVSARLEAGRGTVLDQVRARAQLDTTRATIPKLHAAIRTRMHRIAVLTGNAPGALIAELQPAVPLPESSPGIPVGSPGDVLRRRPDIRAAERRVAAANARIGVATADLFPRFTLGGLLGSVAGDGGDLFTAGAESRRVALGIDWTFLNFAQVNARIDAADSETAAALSHYRQVVLLALEETETWLVRHQQAHLRTALLQSAADAATQAVEQARDRYEQGYIDFFELLDAQQELTRTRDSLVQGRTEEVLAMVNVYRSIAGAAGS